MSHNLFRCLTAGLLCITAMLIVGCQGADETETQSTTSTSTVNQEDMSEAATEGSKNETTNSVVTLEEEAETSEETKTTGDQNGDESDESE